MYDYVGSDVHHKHIAAFDQPVHLKDFSSNLKEAISNNDFLGLLKS
jgi:hypothetical protein